MNNKNRIMVLESYINNYNQNYNNMNMSMTYIYYNCRMN